MPLLVCHVGWMAEYEGQFGKTDKIVGGGRYVRDHHDGGEVCNFLKCADGYVYGHFETIKKRTDRPVSIEYLGADKDAEYIDHVDVVWTATHPTEGGRWVVGWYKDARIYRERQDFLKLPSRQHKQEIGRDYRVRAKAGNAFVIPPKQRDLPLGRGKGWIGQANWWFIERSTNPEVKRFIIKAQALFDNGMRPATTAPSGRGGKWGGKGDPERKAQVESAATRFVEDHYAGYRVKSVEKDNLGWDLEARQKNKPTLWLEVKGLFAVELKVGVTPREYQALRAHMDGSMPHYRLCVVTRALSAKPRLVIFRHDTGSKQWIDERSNKPVSPVIKPLEAAIISLPYPNPQWYL